MSSVYAIFTSQQKNQIFFKNRMTKAVDSIRTNL
jgi:hypothetical protein